LSIVAKEGILLCILSHSPHVSALIIGHHQVILQNIKTEVHYNEWTADGIQVTHPHVEEESHIRLRMVSG
jgi:hypothetical protein